MIKNIFSRTTCFYRSDSLFAIFIILSLLLSAWAAWGEEGDRDQDGMSDEYEELFGLDASHAKDASLNFDTDLLRNLEEFELGTDPLVADTDRDNLNDDMDPDPLSRAVVDWGNPQYTMSDHYVYVGPIWWVSAYKVGGEWNENSWYVSSVSPGGARLVVELDRDFLQSDLVLEMEFSNQPGSGLHIDLLNHQGDEVASDLFGNLVKGQVDSDSVVRKTYTLPLRRFSDATTLQIRRSAGEIRVADTLLYALDEVKTDSDDESDQDDPDDREEEDGTTKEDTIVADNSLQYYWFEAEDVEVASPMQVGSDHLASGRQFVFSPEAGQGSVCFSFTTRSAGDFYVWALSAAGEASPSNQDSFFVGMDDQDEEVWQIRPEVNSNRRKAWDYDEVSTLCRTFFGLTVCPVKIYRGLNQGEHTFKVKGREPGAKLDKILITNDRAFDPTTRHENQRPQAFAGEEPKSRFPT